MAHSDSITEAHGSFGGYIVGFVLSVILTALSFGPVMSGAMDPSTTMIIIAVLALVQIIVHMVFFLHLNPSSGQGWNVLALAYTALAHGSFTIEERLARWLLMAFDRVERSDIPLVHDSIADMLSVRRAGVTHAIHALEGHGAIRATRGLIHLRDRETLVTLAAGSYGLPEREYERLMSTLG